MKKLLLSFLALTTLNAIAQIPTNGLVERFTFDNTLTGINGNSLSGTSNFQNDRNGNSQSAHEIGLAVNSFGNISIANFPTGANEARSIVFWFKHTDNSVHSFFNYQSGVNSNKFYLAYDNEELAFGAQTGGTTTAYTTSMPYSTNWTHVVMSYTGTQVEIFINGASVATQSLSIPVIGPSGYSQIGKSPGGTLYPDFIIDDLLIYNRSLSASEVTQIYGTNYWASINDLNNVALDIFPNPANDLVTINNLTVGSTVTLIDVLGKTVLTQKVTNTTYTVSVADLNNGVYFVQNSDNGRVLATQKLIVSK